MLENDGANAGSAKLQAAATPSADSTADNEAVQLAQAQLAQAGDPIGTVEELTGTVTLTRADGSSTTAAPGDPVYLDDVVSTAAGSSVEIRFVDDTRFSLGQNGQMTLDTLVYNPGGGGNELDLSVVQGAFTFVTGAIAGAPGEGMEVRVPVGTIGIRGTAVGGGPDGTTADPTDYTIVLLPEPGGQVGRIVLTDLNGRSVILDVPLEAMDISSAGLAPGEPVQLTRDQVIDLLGGAVENIEDILDEILNFEPPEEENPEAGEQEGELIPSVPNNGGIRTQLGETQSLDELTTLFTLSDEQGFGANQPVGGFTPTGGLGNTGDQGGPNEGDTGPQQTFDPVTIDDSTGLTVITGGDGDDILDATDVGPAQIVGLAGNDTLIGSSGDDILIGGDGDDILDAGAGNDQVFGQGGNDLIIGGSGQGNDALDGGAGTDTVQYSSATQSITVNLTTGTASGDPAIGSDTLVNIENVIGGQASDVIIGDEVVNTLDGGSGNDFLRGEGGNDTLIGGSGSDTAIFSGNRVDYLIESGAEGSIVVTDLRADGDGVDTLTGIEFLSFADQTLPVGDVGGEQSATEGAAIKTTVTVEAGAVLTLRFNFLDSEPPDAEPSFKDFAAVFIDGESFKLADVDDATSPVGTSSVGFNDQTGYGTFTFTFTAAGTYDLALVVFNEGDFAYDAGLLVDNVSITGGAFADGFESGLEGWETLGDVSVAGAVAGISPAEGEQQALLVSTPATPGAVEAFLGLPPGTMSSVANDGVASDQISYDDVNGIPDAVDDVQDSSGYAFETEEDSELAIGGDELLSNDSDPDGDDLFVTSVGNAVGGTVALGVENLIIFTPTPDYNGPASFTYTVSDGNGGTDTATVNLTVTAANDAPTGLTDVDGDANTIAEDAGNGALVHITAQATDVDAGDILTYSLTNDADGLFQIDPVSGVVTLVEGGTLNGLASPGFDIVVQVSDGNGGVDSQEFTIVVTGVNDDPDAVDDSGEGFSTAEDTPLALLLAQLLANDSDPDANTTLSIQSVQEAVNGSVELIDGQVVFTPAPNYSGPASFTYTVSDGAGGTDTATVSLTVTPVNDDPAGPQDIDEAANLIAENAEPGTALGLTASSSDLEDGTALTYSLTDTAGGRFAIDAVTGVVFLADGVSLVGEAELQHSVTVRATDSQGGFADETFTITVADANDAPTAVDFANTTLSIAENTDTSLGVKVADIVVTDDALGSETLTLVGADAAAFEIVGTELRLKAGVLDFETKDSYSVQVQVDDPTVGDTPDLTSATFTVTVTDANDAPVANDDSGEGLTTPEDTFLVIAPVTLLANDTDQDAEIQLAITAVSGATNGTVELVDGQIVFTPAQNYHGPASFTYTVSDNNGGSDTATVNLTVTPVNDAPSAPVDIDAAANTIAEDTDNGALVGITARSTDVDAGDSVTYSLIDGGEAGFDDLFQIDSVTGEVTLIEGGTLNGFGGSEIDIVVRATDGQGAATDSTFVIAVTNSNGDPVAEDDSLDAAGAPFTVQEDSQFITAAGLLLANDSDPDDDTLTVTEVGGAVNGTVSMDIEGVITFTPAENYSGPASFTYTVSDGHGGTDTATVTLTVNPVNDDPVAVDDGGDGFTVAEDDQLVLSPAQLLANDSDPDAGTTLTVTSVSDPVNGTVGFIENQIVFTPLPGYSGPASFTYTVDDGNGGTDTAVVNIVVTDVNNDVSITGIGSAEGDETVDEANLPEGSSPDAAALTQTGSFTISAPDGIDDLTIGGAAVVTGGVVTLPPPIATLVGTLTITGVDLETGVVSYSYTLSENTTLHGPGDADQTESIGVSVTDVNGDSAVSDLIIRIIDDVPDILIVGSEGAFQLDETENDGDDTLGDGILAQATVSFDALISAAFSPGADGPGTLDVSLDLPAPGTDSGLVDTQTGEAVLLTLVGGDIVGQTEGGLEAFRISVGDGAVTVTQSRAVEHPDALDPDESASPATLAPGLITAVVTLTDGDGDTASDTLDLGQLLSFEDDGPTLAANTDSVSEDGVISASGNVVLDDSAGSDGLGTVAWTGADGGQIAGQYGTLTVGSDGSYSYVLDNALAEVQDLNTGDSLTEVFHYTLTDGDGDGASSTLTITINGQNEAEPVVDLDADDSSGATGTGYRTSFAEGGAPVHIADADATISDADSAELIKIDVLVNPTLDGSNERLSLTTAGQALATNLSLSVSGSGTPALTISGPASPADYQLLLREVVYENVAAEPTAGDHQIMVFAHDGNITNPAALATVTVVPGNEEPDFVATVAEDAAYQLNSSEISTVGEPEFIFYTLDSQPEHGTVQRAGIPLNLGANFTQADIDQGLVTYVHNTDDPAESDSFLLTVDDGVNPPVQRSVGVTIVHSGTAYDADVVFGDTLIVGDGGYGRLDLLFGGTEAAGLILIGNQPTGNGVVRVSDAGSSLTSLTGLQRIDVGAEGSGRIDIENAAQVRANTVNLGLMPGGQGIVTVAGPGAVLVTQGEDNFITVGWAGQGQLDLSAGGKVSTLWMDIGFDSGGDGFVSADGAGSAIIVSNDLGRFSGEEAQYGGLVRVGVLDGSEGALNVVDGATMEIRSGYLVNTDTIAPGMTIAQELGSRGSVLLSGAGSRIDVFQADATVSDPTDAFGTLQGPFVTVGQMGEAHMTVTDHAVLAIRGNEPYLGVGGGNFGNPEDTTPLPQSTLTISAGGSVTVTETGTDPNVTADGGVYIGDYRNGNGRVVVTGEGSSLETHGTNAIIIVGREGVGVLDVNDGASVGTLFLGMSNAASGAGTVNIDGAGSRIVVSNDYGVWSAPFETDAGSVRVGRDWGSHGYLNITNGGALLIGEGQSTNTETTFPWLNIARDAGSEGDVLVDGVGSTLTVGVDTNSYGAGIDLGNGGIGRMIVSDGANVTTNGTDNYISVGRQSTAVGQLTVQGGGEVNTLSLNIGREGNGTVTVNGAGSQVRVSNDTGVYSDEFSIEGGFVNVGREAGSQGLLQVLAGGVLEIADNAQTEGPGLQIARNSGSTGTVVVDGAGSQINVTATGPVTTLWGPYIDLGIDGDGSLSISNGGAVTVSGEGAQVNVAAFTHGPGTGTGTVTITGTGSELDINGTNSLLAVGQAGAGTVSVQNGGMLRVDVSGDDFLDLYVGANGILDVAGGTVVGDVVLEGGRLSVGESSIATGTVDGHVVFETGAALKIEAQSTTQRDQLNVTGQASLQTGLISFSFLAGYLPQADDSFSFLTASNLVYTSPVVSLEAWGVSPLFEFTVNRIGQSLIFEAQNDATPGNGVVRYGTNFDDFIAGTDGDDGLRGLVGADTLTGGAGDDHLWGGLGSDTLDGGDGIDTADFSDIGGGAVTVDLISGEPVQVFVGADPTDTLIDIENVVGTALNDQIAGDQNANHLVGGAGQDSLMGQGGADILDGGSGNDILIVGNLDFNFVDGGADTDTLTFEVSSLINLASLDIRNVEQIDLGGNGGNTLALVAGDVLGMNADDALLILGDSNDAVTLNNVVGAEWVDGGNVILGSISFSVYTANGATVYVDNEIATQNIV